MAKDGICNIIEYKILKEIDYFSFIYSITSKNPVSLLIIPLTQWYKSLLSESTCFCREMTFYDMTLLLLLHSGISSILFLVKGQF